MKASDHSDECACELAAEAAADAPAASAPGQAAAAVAGVAIRRVEFLARIDQCVRSLAAWLGADTRPGPSDDAERASAELWRWLHAGPAVLDDGTPITFPVFDNALQRVVERLPRRGLPGQEHLLRAAWLLAEATHAPVRASFAGFVPSRALP